ncbi:MAG: WbqC family protein, partial [Bacteroidia bacterium]|nr:WbqC family protein [Bacteroidia bacterium]
VTIHQPDFMPWLGLFNKINNADEFIILDHVTNNPKSPEFWCRRVKMLIGGKEHWMSITLKKDKLNTFIPINCMELDMDEKTVKKFIQSVELNYKRAPYFNDVFYLVENYFSLNGNNLSKKNSWFISEVMKKLNINTPYLYSSDLNPQFTSNEMLIDLLKKRNATVYLCGNGAGSYQKDELYLNEGIKVKYNQFTHPEYSQFNSTSFTKGLSIIDALMNLGFKGTAHFFDS